MNRQLLLLLITGILLLSFIKSDDDKHIRWNENQKLKWEDFQGKLDKNIIQQNHLESDQVIVDGNTQTTIHTETDAYCYHEIGFSANYTGDTLTFEVRNQFDKAMSWSQTTSEYILNHEQRHFDLGEVYARMFRKYITDSVKNYNPAAQKKMFNRFLNEDIEAQKKYDTETNHSINTEVQNRYNNEIDSLLNAYSAYAEIQIKKYCPQPKRKRR